MCNVLNILDVLGVKGKHHKPTIVIVVDSLNSDGVIRLRMKGHGKARVVYYQNGTKKYFFGNMPEDVSAFRPLVANIPADIGTAISVQGDVVNFSIDPGDGESIRELNCYDNSALEYLYAYELKLQHFTLKDCPNLKSIELYMNNLKDVEFITWNHWNRYLDLSDNPDLLNITFPEPPNGIRIKLQNTAISSSQQTQLDFVASLPTVQYGELEIQPPYYMNVYDSAQSKGWFINYVE